MSSLPPDGTGRDPMDDDLPPEADGEGWTETQYSQQRSPGRTYISRSFRINRENSSDFGKPARFVSQVYDSETESKAAFDGEEWVISESPKGRSQVRLLVCREAGQVKEFWIQRVPSSGTPDRNKLLLNLRQPDAQRLIDLLRSLDYVPVDEGETVRLDEDLVRDLFTSPQGISSVYRSNPERFRQLIADDASARDLIAVSHRREQVERFHELMGDDAAFDLESARRGGPEAVWQHFFEENPWIFGLSLTGQLLTSWNSDRLEQIVAGRSVATVGKRVDALLRTSGRIRSMVFAEIKTHRQRLLGAEYRPGCWAPSKDLVSGVAQSHGTVHRAVGEIGERINSTDAEGAEILGDTTYLLRPRSFLVVGSLWELQGESGGPHMDKLRSFELYRRSLTDPEIITFDELLARAEWLVGS